MLKRTMAVAFAMLVVMAAGSAAAQCTAGIYGDADGTVGTTQGFRSGDPFHMYVVLFTENLVNAMSFGLEIPDLNTDIFIQDVSYGRSGNGINVIFGGQNNVGLGECAVGFAGQPVVVADYTLMIPVFAAPRMVSLLPAPDSKGNTPLVVSDCSGVLSSCDIGPSLLVEGPAVPTEASSFGAVKSLYHN